MITPGPEVSNAFFGVNYIDNRRIELELYQSVIDDYPDQELLIQYDDKSSTHYRIRDHYRLVDSSFWLDTENIGDDATNDGIPVTTDLFLRITQSDDDDYKFIGIDFDEPLQDLSSIEVQNP